MRQPMLPMWPHGFGLHCAWTLLQPWWPPQVQRMRHVSVFDVHPRLDITVAAVCSANGTRHCTTDKPKGDRNRRGPRDAERAWAAEHPSQKCGVVHSTRYSRGAARQTSSVAHIHDVVSSSAVSATNYKLVCTESWERVSSLCSLGDDIFTMQHEFLHKRIPTQ